jgi:phage gp45-like
MPFDSKTRHGPGELADAVGATARAMSGAFRRMAIKVTSTALWQVIGHRLLDGSRETRDAEVFYGVGFWARPTSSEKAEAFVTFTAGGSGSPLIVATRNEDARRAVAAALTGGTIAEGETLIFGSPGTPIVYLKANGTVEIRLPGGAAVALATKADVDAVATFLKKQFDTALGHTHAALGSPPVVGTGTVGTGFSVPAAAGTSVLKAN